MFKKVLVSALGVVELEPSGFGQVFGVAATKAIMAMILGYGFSMAGKTIILGYWVSGLSQTLELTDSWVIGLADRLESWVLGYVT